MGGGSLTAVIGGLAIWLSAAAIIGQQSVDDDPGQPHASGVQALHFQTSETCLSCHNSLTAASGEDVSIGSAWRGSIMANSSRDPYWQASVKKETLDHPAQARAIEDECATCHMPMARTLARSRGVEGQVFAHLPIGQATSEASRLAADGVSCTLCHQISPERLGTTESFTGGFVVKPATAAGATIFGPFQVDAGRARLMHSATGVMPAEGRHIQESALCATCHTLYTKALGPGGEVIGSLPEQVPYLEWQHSAYRHERSCQSCHMPEVSQPTAVASVLGDPRPGLSRHTFVGGNFFMLRMLNRYRWSSLSRRFPANWTPTPARRCSSCNRVQRPSPPRHLGTPDATLTIDVRSGTSPVTSFRAAIRRAEAGFTSPCAMKAGASCSNRARFSRPALSPGTTTTPTAPATNGTTTRSAQPIKSRSTNR